jgi:hypothetical protein
MRTGWKLALCLLVCCPQQLRGEEPLALNPQLQKLAEAFFNWRQSEQPSAADDITRVERPAGWLPRFGPSDLAIYRVRYREFLDQLSALPREGFSQQDEVDAMLLASAIKRVGWELDVLRVPQRNPQFYLDQTLGSVFELLVLSTPMTAQRLQEIILRLRHFPAVLEDGRANLSESVRPFALVAVENLQGMEPYAGVEQKEDLQEAAATASQALAEYREWLQRNLAGMAGDFGIGPRAYQWFLANVALIPHTPDELLALGRQEWNRSVAWDTLERSRNRDLPPLPVFTSLSAQAEASLRHEGEIRAFLQSQDLMTLPGWLRHYRNREMPAYLKPIAFMGVTDDLTSASRLDQDAYSYIPAPSPDLPFFQRSAAMDPRPLIAHEGIPGHYFQLALSWANPDPIRRHYFDSGANEGIAFYAEELLLQAGLFSFSPRSREIIYAFMRLRALRVEVDIRLATGEFSLEQAADYLARTVPMDRHTAAQEAVFFAGNPGQAISYQVGKNQVIEFLAAARLDQGEAFSLRQFHDALLVNGNVPIALQRWQLLGRDEQIGRLQSLQARPSTVPE